MQNLSKITKNNSQGILIVIIPCRPQSSGQERANGTSTGWPRFGSVAVLALNSSSIGKRLHRTVRQSETGRCSCRGPSWTDDDNLWILGSFVAPSVYLIEGCRICKYNTSISIYFFYFFSFLLSLSCLNGSATPGSTSSQFPVRTASRGKFIFLCLIELSSKITFFFQRFGAFSHSLTEMLLKPSCHLSGQKLWRAETRTRELEWVHFYSWKVKLAPDHDTLPISIVMLLQNDVPLLSESGINHRLVSLDGAHLYLDTFAEVSGSGFVGTFPFNVSHDMLVLQTCVFNKLQQKIAREADVSLA